MIFLMPLVSALSTSMRSTTTAKENQERNEYVRNLMENVKEMPASALKDETTAESYFTNLGATSVVWEDKGSAGNFEKYVISGSTKLGIKDTMYAYTIEVSGEDYAAAGTLDPNKLTHGVVEDFDRLDVALISAPFANYDYPAFDSLMTKKMAELRKRHEANGVDFDADADMGLIQDDTGSREIIIDVSKDLTDKYTVKCILRYSDDNEEASSTTGMTIGDAIGYVEYVPYAQEFDKLPNIYLMYNTCVYNGKYAQDTITINKGNLTEDVNVFVVATTGEVDSNNNLRYRDLGDRSGLTVNFSNPTGTDADKYVNVYHNLFINDGSGMTNNKFMPTVNYNSSKFKSFGSLNDAQDNRGLYKVKIWMQKGSVDTSSSPVLQGTRGGDEIE